MSGVFASRKFSRPAPVAAVTVAAAAALTLTACGGQNDEPANDPTDDASAVSEATETTESSTESSTEPSTTTATSTATATSSATPSTGATTTHSGAGAAEATAATQTSKSKSSSRGSETLKEVRERFSTLAPGEFFDKLDECSPSGISGSFDCSGDEIGQFQFFDSESKAASTTQLLTELRSSRVVEDNGDRIVGWSTLGTSAIITVVDNRAGQVLQQLVSSDQEDPRQCIYDLGLATR